MSSEPQPANTAPEPASTTPSEDATAKLTPEEQRQQSDAAASETDAAPAPAGVNPPATTDAPPATTETMAAASGESNPTPPESAKPAGGRGAGPLAARGLGVAKPASPSVSTEQLSKVQEAGGKGSGSKPKKKKSAPRPRLKGESDQEATSKPTAPRRDAARKVAVPSVRGGLSDDLQAELDAELAAADVESMLGGSAGMSDRKEPISEGTRISGRVLKIHQDSVYLALGGPDEAVVPLEQFTEAEPTVGQSVEVIVRGMSREDGLYLCTLPGSTIDVADWSDLEEGSVVEAVVTGHNSGGLECKVGGVRGFMPISQIAEYRVEDASEFVDQKFVCLVTEANERRGNLVLSRRAILEREREEKRKEQLETIEPGDVLEGVVRLVKDFGAFVDLGALDGLIHVSKLSWERIKHPSEVVGAGQKLKVRIDSVDKDTGKISLSYRDLLENPWDTAEAEFAVGSIHRGTITRIAPFGCFVRLAPGVEGLVHVSELAHHRVSKVDAFVSEGQEVDVKVLSFDRDSQKIGLSIKAAKQIAEDDAKTAEPEIEEPQREVAVKPSHAGPLKGGNNRDSGGERFGLRW
ncbi:S1 RNA-binding domain-containing protein [Roseiconus nitratireducens]|uniref:S1 RNA-binding domain-containing protein n=1 Tax=Roseiconus nitratireducens TaxID=2605748 RepID=A0A5M6CTH6_9BACT|nr:S1 RNA-binding domain-containing protein [Roseiconus nitratireducens]KAA5538557.1 S1 RNA-binding domain-containing protein [Roseiconus nitratireducens]